MGDKTMCGRYVLRNQPEWTTHSLWKSYWQKINDFTPRYNIAPSQQCPVVISGAEGPQRVMMRWGFRPSWAKAAFAQINARAETLSSSKMFAKAARYTRCLVPADGFYEPKGPKSSKSRAWHFFQFNDQRVFMMAGIHTRFKSDKEDYWNFSIVTTAANTAVNPIHHRMPVILAPEQWDEWLGKKTPIDFQAFIEPQEYPQLGAYPVSDRVKDPHNDGPDCVSPLVPTNLSLF